MLAVFDKIDATAFANHEKDAVRRFASRLANDAKQASRKRAFLLVGPAVAHIEVTLEYSPSEVVSADQLFIHFIAERRHPGAESDHTNVFDGKTRVGLTQKPRIDQS